MRSPLSGWLGGKFKLAKRIVKMLPEDHQCYCEPFAGAAWVLFFKEPSKSEVLNDFNSEIVNLYRVLQHHLEEFLRYFKWVLISREEFERLKKLPAESLTDIQRAARFYYIQKMCFGGRINRPTFCTRTTDAPKLNLVRIEEELSAVHLRLSRVVVEHLPYADVITRYDRPATVFYIDPPYWGIEDYYGKDMFSRDDFAVLAAQLATIKGRFILSLNDVPEVRDIFEAFEIAQVDTTYSVGRNNTPAKELLIRNY